LKTELSVSAISSKIRRLSSCSVAGENILEIHSFPSIRFASWPSSWLPGALAIEIPRSSCTP
jgi:hypothetical protein